MNRVEFQTKKFWLKPEKLKVNSDRPYAFKSSLKTTLTKLMDKLGDQFLAPPFQEISWGAVKRLALIRLDHLGDVLLTLPAMESIVKALPGIQIDIFVGPWSVDLIHLSNLPVGIKVFKAPWFDRLGYGSSSFQAIRKLAAIFKKEEYDLVIDFRGDFRHLAAMRMAGIPNRIGYNRTGGGFLLTFKGQWKAELHETLRNLDLLEQIGIKPSSASFYPRIYPSEEEIQKGVQTAQSLDLNGPMIAIHATCGASSKRWPAAYWRELIQRLPAGYSVVMVGAASEKEDMMEIIKGCSRRVIVAAGIMELPVLAAFLKQCQLFIGVDSGPAHIAAAVGTPVLSIFSGANLVAQWAPRGEKVLVLQEKTKCSPCERLECPLGNECMRQLKVSKVVQSSLKLLRS